MNLILFTADEISGGTIYSADNRYKHIVKILKLTPGEVFQAGIVNGPKGTAKILSMDNSAIHYRLYFDSAPVTGFPITVIIGLVRPPTTQRLLRDLTSLGVERIIFSITDLTEKSYLQGRLWQNDSYKELLIRGAEQAKSTFLPKVDKARHLQEAYDLLAVDAVKFVLDDALKPAKTGDLNKQSPVGIFIGPERGWSEKERNWFCKTGIPGIRLNNRVLRTETAAIASVSLLLNKMGYLQF